MKQNLVNNNPPSSNSILSQPLMRFLPQSQSNGYGSNMHPHHLHRIKKDKLLILF